MKKLNKNLIMTPLRLACSNTKDVKDSFCRLLDFRKPCCVLYNTVESDRILEMSKEETPRLAQKTEIRLIAVGSLKRSKGYKRMLRIIKRLYKMHYPVHLYVLGAGPLQEELQQYIGGNNLENVVTLLGYDTNPYRYIAKCDLFVCASYAEGFSTAATEALIVGTPICTVAVSGMKELLGGNNEYGIVTDNDEEALFHGIKRILDSPTLLDHYQKKALERGKVFSTENTVRAVEAMLLDNMEC